MAKFIRGTKLWVHRPEIIMEQLEERIVFDASVANTDHNDDASQTHTDSQTSTATTATSAEGAIQAATNPGGSAASPQPDSVTQSVSQIYNQDLNVVLISNAINQIESIKDAVAPNAKVVMYDAAGDTLATVVSKLEALSESTGQKIGHLAIVSEGQPGALLLDPVDDVYSLSNLADTAPVWMQLSESLAPGARIDFYGCNIGQGDVGMTFVSEVATLTHSIVWASSDNTGNVSGADWVLETQTAPDSRDYLLNSLALDGSPILLKPANNAPLDVDVSLLGNENSPIEIVLTGDPVENAQDIVSFNFGDLSGILSHGTLHVGTPLGASISSSSSVTAGIVHGSGADPDTLTVYFVPDANYTGTTSFSYSVTDSGDSPNISDGAIVGVQVQEPATALTIPDVIRFENAATTDIELNQYFKPPDGTTYEYSIQVISLDSQLLNDPRFSYYLTENPLNATDFTPEPYAWYNPALFQGGSPDVSGHHLLLDYASDQYGVNLIKVTAVDHETGLEAGYTVFSVAVFPVEPGIGGSTTTTVFDHNETTTVDGAATGDAVDNSFGTFNLPDTQVTLGSISLQGDILGVSGTGFTLNQVVDGSEHFTVDGIGSASSPVLANGAQIFLAQLDADAALDYTPLIPPGTTEFYQLNVVSDAYESSPGSGIWFQDVTLTAFHDSSVGALAPGVNHFFDYHFTFTYDTSVTTTPVFLVTTTSTIWNGFTDPEGNTVFTQIGTLGSYVNDQPNSQFSVDGDPTTSAVFADVNNDGLLDVVVGTWRDPQQSLGNWGLYDLVYLNLGDLNNDGKLNFNEAGIPNEFQIIDVQKLNVPDNSGFPTGPKDRTTDIAVGDFNADGWLDLIRVTEEGFDYVNLGTHSGSTWTGFDTDFADTIVLGFHQHASTAVALGDLNNDGWLDAVVGTKSGDLIYANVGENASGTWLGFATSLAIDGSQGQTGALSVGDINADGALDIFSGKTNGGNDQYYINPGFVTDDGSGNADGWVVKDVPREGLTLGVDMTDLQATFASLLPSDPNYNPSLINDINWDAVTANLAQGPDPGSEYFYIFDGVNVTQHFVNDPPPQLPDNSYAIIIADVNHDGIWDLVVGNSQDITTVANNATNPFERHDPQANALYLGSLDGSGNLQFTFNGFLGLDISYLVWGEQPNTPPVQIQPGFGGNFETYAVAAGDLNGDGAPDIFYGNRLGMDLILWNQGWTQHEESHFENGEPSTDKTDHEVSAQAAVDFNIVIQPQPPDDDDDDDDVVPPDDDDDDDDVPGGHEPPPFPEFLAEGLPLNTGRPFELEALISGIVSEFDATFTPRPTPPSPGFVFPFPVSGVTVPEIESGERLGVPPPTLAADLWEFPEYTDSGADLRPDKGENIRLVEVIEPVLYVGPDHAEAMAFASIVGDQGVAEKAVDNGLMFCYVGGGCSSGPMDPGQAEQLIDQLRPKVLPIDQNQAMADPSGFFDLSKLAFMDISSMDVAGEASSGSEVIVDGQSKVLDLSAVEFNDILA